MSPRVNSTWRTYAFWFFWISIVFFTVYPLCNWLTAKRDVTFNLYITQEFSIPFVPEFIWIYLSLYLLFFIPPFVLEPMHMNALGRQLVGATFVCGLAFLLLPAELGFDRTIPEDPFYGALFAGMFELDLPHNLVPSLHVAFSALILITLLRLREETSGQITLRCLASANLPINRACTSTPRDRCGHGPTRSHGFLSPHRQGRTPCLDEW